MVGVRVVFIENTKVGLPAENSSLKNPNKPCKEPSQTCTPTKMSKLWISPKLIKNNLLLATPY